MKSLKHYFSSPTVISNGKADLPKEPLHDVSEKANQDSPLKDVPIVKSSKKGRKAKSEKQSALKNGDIVKEAGSAITIGCDVNEKDKCENGETSSKKVDMPKEPQAVGKETPPSSKPNAFQLLMSHKKKSSPEGEGEKKRLNLSLKNAKKIKSEDACEEGEKNAANNTHKEDDGCSKNESVTENGRKSRRSRKNANSSSNLDEFEASGRTSNRTKKQEKKTEESKALKSAGRKTEKMKKIVLSDDDELENSQVPEENAKVINNAIVTEKGNKSDEAEVMEIDICEKVHERHNNIEPQSKLPVEEDLNGAQPISKKNSKRKRDIISSDEETSPGSPQKVAPKHAKKSIFGYFTPISKDEAQKRAAKALEAPKVQTIMADIHPEPVISQKRRSMGPSGRVVSSMSPQEQESIQVLEVTYEPTAGHLETPKKQSPMKLKRPKRLWELRVRLLSPAKSISEASCDSSDSDDTDSEIEIVSPSKRQISKTNGWGAGGKLAPIFLPKNRNSTATSAPRKIFQSAPLPKIRAAPTEHTIGFADEDPEAPIAALFPSVSHVGEYVTKASETDEKTTSIMNLLSYGEEKENIKPPSSFDLGTISKVSAFNKLKTAKKKNAGESAEAWCDKYKPKLSDAVAGNESSVLRLRSWLERWTEIKSSGAKELPSESGSDLDSMDDFIVSDDDENSNTDRRKKKKKKTANTVLLVGPSGSGKTAAVYAIADELGFKVLEVNASSKRSGKRILAELREATQSHQVRSGPVDQESITTFFGKGKGNHNSDTHQNSIQSLSLILVEDVDIVFEEQDDGFMAALNSLAENSKRPLVLVSNDQNCSLVLTRQHRIHFEFEKVPVNKSADVIEDICELEGSVAGRECIKAIVVDNQGDLRSSLHCAQFLFLSGGFPKTRANSLKFPLDFEELALRLQTKPKPFIISESDLEDSKVEDSPKLNNTWDDSDSDNILFNSTQKLKKPKRKPRIDLGSNEEVDAQKVSVSLDDLKKMSRLADCVAALDVLQGIKCGDVKSTIMPGLSDQLEMEAVPDSVGPLVQHLIATKALKHYQVTNLGLEHWESNQRWHKSHESVIKGLKEHLPIYNQLAHRDVSLDFLPILRELGKSEQSSARSSRRSAINCLQSIGMQPDQFVLEALPFVLTR